MTFVSVLKKENSRKPNVSAFRYGLEILYSTAKLVLYPQISAIVWGLGEIDNRVLQGRTDNRISRMSRRITKYRK